MTPTPRRQVCTFFVAGHFVGIDVADVQEVISYQQMTRVPLAPAVVRGLINLRGQIVTALDLRRHLAPDRDLPPRPMNVIVRSPDGPTSLLVDEMGDVLDVAADSFEPPPEALRGPARDLIRGAYKLQGRLLLSLDVEKAINLSGGAPGLIRFSENMAAEKLAKSPKTSEVFP